MGSTLSLADKPKGMIRSGSFRDPVDDGEGVLRSCPGEGGCAGGLHARLSRCCGAIGCFGASRPRRRSRGRQLQGAWWTPLRWHLLWAAACPVPCECPVSLGWPQGAVAPGEGGPKQPGRVAEPPGSAGEVGAGGGCSSRPATHRAPWEVTSHAPRTEQCQAAGVPPSASLPPPESPCTGSSVPCTLLRPAPAAPGDAAGAGHPDTLPFVLLQFTDRCCPWPRARPPPTPP